VSSLLVEIDPVVQTKDGDPLGSVFIETYGCQMNVSDSELMRGVLGDAGFSSADSIQEADVVLLNTCAIREHAEERVLGRLSQLRHLKTRKPDLVLGVCGCMAKHMSEKLMDRLPYVDLVLGPDSYRDLADLVVRSRNEPSLSVRLDRAEHYDGVDPVRTDGVNAWVTVQRGCDKFCTFCVVPYVRGRERSVRSDEVVRQVEVAAADGFKEVTLLGQTVNSYHDGVCDFPELLRRLSNVQGIDRVRFTSPHPSDFDDRLIATIAEVDEICKFVHLPVQSGSTKVLKRMQRTYSRESYLALVERLREEIPSLALSTDIIVGFPDETAGDFEETLELVRRVRFDFAFMFKYSEREGTVAHREIPDTVPETEKSSRLESLIELQSRISAEVNNEYIGSVLDVLVEGKARKGKGRVYGKSDGFKTVVFTSEALPNTIVPVRITSATQKTLLGEVTA
tara:strand:+ start:1660 stop:3015 length:1356 start_codon:yes stop_codon:yes gene_type:complete